MVMVFQMKQIFLAFCIISLVNQVHSQCVSSTDNFINGLCYSIFKTPMNYNDARQFCHSQNNGVATYLAVIQNGLQANFLASMMDTSISTFWIGLSRASSSDRFMWDDGSVMYWNYFDNNYPKNDNYASEMTVNGKWRTTDPNTQLEFVCSYNPSGPPVTQTTGSYTYGPTSTLGIESTTGYPEYQSTTAGTTDNVNTDTTQYSTTGSTEYATSEQSTQYESTVTAESTTSSYSTFSYYFTTWQPITNTETTWGTTDDSTGTPSYPSYDTTTN